MSQLIVRHRVKDFKKWKMIFTASEFFRRMVGEKSCKIFRNVENQNDISIVFEWASAEKFLKYSQSEELRDAMKQAGVEENPIVYLCEDDVKD